MESGDQKTDTGVDDSSVLSRYNLIWWGAADLISRNPINSPTNKPTHCCRKWLNLYAAELVARMRLDNELYNRIPRTFQVSICRCRIYGLCASPLK